MTSLLTNPLYLLVNFGLISLIFAARTILYWAITYMQEVLFMDPIEAQSIFTIVLLSSMVPGFMLSSSLIDKIGGYKGKAGLIRSIFLVVIFSVVATGFSLVVTNCADAEMFAYLFWG